MAKKRGPATIKREQELDVEHLKRQLDMLNQRLDNIDSVVTAVVERVMNQPIALSVTCPNCGKNMEIALIGINKLKG